MSKIYICEAGYKYEEGSVVAASTSFLNAWKMARKLRIECEQMDERVMRLVGNCHWASDHEYLLIREFDDV